MQLAILSCEFLLSPASADKNIILEQIESLMEIKQFLKNREGAPILEDDALRKLTERSKFPAEGIFKVNMTRCNVTAFSAKDVARTVNSILSLASSCATTLPDRLLEWTTRLFDPGFSQIPEDRKSELEQLLEKTATLNKIDRFNLGFLFHCNINKFSKVNVRGSISTIYPELDTPLPLDFSESVSIYTNYKEYLASIDHYTIFDRSPEIEGLRFAFYVGALRRIKSKGRSLSSISFNKIYIGGNFYESLKLNQCLPYQNFAHVTLDTVVDVLASYMAKQMNIFETSAGSNEARKHGHCTAFREHVTKSGVALRLMFWVDDQGNIELANVGPKNELTIYDPQCI